MSYETLGSQSTDRPTTPTLRQYLNKSGGICAKATNVTIIFRPGKYGGWSLVADGRFRVEVAENNPLHRIITENIKEWMSNQTTLVIRVDDGSKPEWELAINTDSLSEWDEASWGFKLKLVEPKNRKPTGQKATRRSSGSDGGADA